MAKTCRCIDCGKEKVPAEIIEVNGKKVGVCRRCQKTHEAFEQKMRELKKTEIAS